MASWGYRAVAVSVVSGQGLEELTGVLRGRVTVVAGPSGAGKSSIINALRMRSLGLDGSLEAMAAEPSGAEVADESCGEEEEEEDEEEEEEEDSGSEGEDDGTPEASSERRQDGAQPPAAAEQQQQQQRPGGNHSTSSTTATNSSASAAVPEAALPADLELQAVGQVSQRIGRGKHTTRNVTLLELEGSGGGLVVDTPGFNQPDLAGLPAGELGQHFPEIRALIDQERCGSGWQGGPRVMGAREARRVLTAAVACCNGARCVACYWSPPSHLPAGPYASFVTPPPAPPTGAPSGGASTCTSRGAWCGRRGGSATLSTRSFTRSLKR